MFLNLCAVIQVNALCKTDKTLISALASPSYHSAPVAYADPKLWPISSEGVCYKTDDGWKQSFRYMIPNTK
jgi:hypothetical protein